MTSLTLFRIMLPVALALVLSGCASAPETAPVAAVSQPVAPPENAAPPKIIPIVGPAPEPVPEPASALVSTVETAPVASAEAPAKAVPAPVEAVREEPAVTPEPPPAEPVVVVPLVTEPVMPAATDAPSVAFLRPGEVLHFRMSWGIFGNIGDTRIATNDETIDGQRRFRIKITTQSHGILDAIYPVVNDSESIIDRTTGRPLQITVEGKSGNRPTKTLTIFDYKIGKIVHTDFLRPERSGTAELPPEPAYDLMVAMLQARDWHMKPGDKRDVLTAFEDEFYFITLTAHQREKVRTTVGTFDAVMIEPTQNGEQKGFFKRGGSMKFWISNEPVPQVVKMVFKTKAGTITALLQRTSPDEGQGPPSN